MTPQKVKMATGLMKDSNITAKQICETLGVSRPTLYRYVSPEGEVRKE
jgi:predicted DNA-binding transcriptional regulator AlpA